MIRNNLVKVDIFDNQLGVISKTDAHKSPILHRAFSVFLYNDNKEILIQKRAENKYHSAGLWANACCSHPQKDENIIQSAKNRLGEELGISTDLRELFTFTYMNKFNDNLYEYELDHVLIGKYNGEINLNLEEASEYKWISIDELNKQLTDSPQDFASWFIICAPQVASFLKHNNWQFHLFIILYTYP